MWTLTLTAAPPVMAVPRAATGATASMFPVMIKRSTAAEVSRPETAGIQRPTRVISEARSFRVAELHQRSTVEHVREGGVPPLRKLRSLLAGEG